jgi:hypothetical protein
MVDLEFTSNLIAMYESCDTFVTPSDGPSQGIAVRQTLDKQSNVDEVSVPFTATAVQGCSATRKTFYVWQEALPERLISVDPLS